MTSGAITYRGGRIFDGEALRDGFVAQFEGGTLVAIEADDGTYDGTVVVLARDILCDGYVDLQVDGGDGVMQGDDPSVEVLLDAAQHLPVLKVTLAPENVTEAQVTTLVAAGAVESLGHSDADFDTCARYFAAGTTCTTHLFNATRQLTNREPGLVGAALAHGGVAATSVSADLTGYNLLHGGN